LLGSVTTQHLVQNVFSSLDLATEPGLSIPFENMLQEVNQLRSVSERLATLADEHPDVGDGLVGISGNIRDLATILDVFAAIKRRSEELHEGELSLQAARYVM
jgi:exopolyphosphatase/pppGpp-phosphohydrolase